MMYVQQVRRLSDFSSEATIIISDGVSSIQAFYYGSNFEDGDRIVDPLHAFEPVQIVRESTYKERLVKNKTPMVYHVTGMLTDKELGIVKVAFGATFNCSGKSFGQSSR